MSGFTLVELVVVIMILGILAALAVPRFVEMQTAARYAKGKATLGTIRSAAEMAKAAAKVAGQTGSTGTVTLEGTAVDLVNGLPAATPSGILAAAGLELSDGMTVSVSGPLLIVYMTSDLAAPNDCRVVYQAPTYVGGPYTAYFTASVPYNCRQ